MSAIHVNRVSIGRNAPVKIQRKRELQIELQSKLQELQSEYQQRLDEYESIDVKLQHYTASIAPIKTIPSELLLEIFQQVVELVWGERSKQDLVTLTSVCKHWREVAIQNPLLYNQIDVKMYEEPVKTYKQLDYIDLFLERSKGALLNITISLVYEEWSHRTIREETNDLVRSHFSGQTYLGMNWEMRNWIEQHIESVPASNHYPDITIQILNKVIGPNGENMTRWRSLDLALYNERNDYYLSLFKGRTPNLKSLYIEMHLSRVMENDRLSEGNAMYHSFPFIQSLESLTLRCRVSPSCLRLNPKVIISLDVYETPQGDTLISLPSFINLQKLSYRAMNTTHPPSHAKLEELSSVKVYLPLLETLEFFGHHIPLVFRVFDVPKLSTLGIHAYIGSKHARPIGRMFRYPSKINLFWPSSTTISHTDSVPLIKEFLMQCTSLTILDAKSIGWSAMATVLQGVEECRAVPQGLSNLQTVTFKNEVVTFKPKTAPEFPISTCPDPISS